MKILVTYRTETGMTESVASAIFGALDGPKAIMPMNCVEGLDEYDLVFAGFPVMQFGAPKPVREFARKLNGKRVALFVVHAMPSQDDDPRLQAMLTKELENCRKAFSGADICGFFHCRGELPAAMADEMIASGIPMLEEFALMRPKTIGHPDASELSAAADFARVVTAGLEND